MLTQQQLQQSFQNVAHSPKIPAEINIKVENGKVVSGKCDNKDVGFEFSLDVFKPSQESAKPAYLFRKNTDKRGVYEPIMDDVQYTKENKLNRMIFDIISSNPTYAFTIKISENQREYEVFYDKMCEIFSGDSTKIKTPPSYAPNPAKQQTHQRHH